MRTLWYAGLLVLTGFVLFACQSGDLVVGQSVINPQELVVQSIDTVSIRTSTVMRPDSFLTSIDDAVVVGHWTDTQTGKMTVRGFSAFNYTANTLTTQTNVRIDSLVLELTYAYAYGDTTSLFDVGAYPLSKPLVNQFYYNTSTVAYGSKAAARKSVLPQPNSRSRQVRFTMTDSLAQALYAKLRSGDIKDAVTLAEFLPGFALESNSATNTFAGFATATSGLKLYYRSNDLDGGAQTLLFPFTAAHFTQLRNDLSGTPLSVLINRSDAVSSRLTDNTTFVVPAAQLSTRIEFPYLNQFSTPEGFADINKALLIIRPVRKNVRDNVSPPAPLALFFTNTQNDILSLTLPGGVTGSSSPVAAYDNGISTDPISPVDSYTFDLTYYISQIIKRKSLNYPLLLTIIPNSQLQTPHTLREYIQRVTIGNQQRPNDQMKVQLFITSGT